MKALTAALVLAAPLALAAATDTTGYAVDLHAGYG
jgi:hypothetical protein